MFDELVDSGEKKRTNKPWTVVVSALIQVVILGVLVLIPLIYTEALPKSLITTFLVAPAPPPPPPPPAAAIVKIIKPQVHLLHNGQLTTPTVIPKKVSIIKEEAEPPDMGGSTIGGVVGGVAGGSANGVLNGIIGGAGNAPPPPPPKASNKPYRVGGNVMEAKKMRNVLPVYPQIAKTAHIQGTVLLHAIIDKDGSIQELTYISGPPLLMRAAMDAVRQWRYQPTELNGEAVAVDTQISVIFSLGG